MTIGGEPPPPPRLSSGNMPPFFWKGQMHVSKCAATAEKFKVCDWEALLEAWDEGDRIITGLAVDLALQISLLIEQEYEL